MIMQFLMTDLERSILRAPESSIQAESTWYENICNSSVYKENFPFSQKFTLQYTFVGKLNKSMGSESDRLGSSPSPIPPLTRWYS